jgi:hypothetical protein
MVETTGCPLDEIDRYKVPTDLSLPGCLTQIQSIEDPIEPAVLGLNENAAILRNTNDSLDFLEGVLATQPQVEDFATRLPLENLAKRIFRGIGNKKNYIS